MKFVNKEKLLEKIEKDIPYSIFLYGEDIKNCINGIISLKDLEYDISELLINMEIATNPASWREIKQATNESKYLIELLMNNKLDIEENKDDSSSKIKLYKDIFGESPWNEGFICKNCGTIYSKKFMGKCNCSESDLEPFYKNRELKNTFKDLKENKGYFELLAKSKEENIGFIWGWNTSLNKLNNDKLGLDEQNLDKLTNEILSKYPDFNLENFYYFAEIGVKNKFRGENIAGDLYRKKLEKLSEKGEKYIVVRTTRKSDIPYKWFKNMGYEDIFLYEDVQDRVILIFKIQ